MNPEEAWERIKTLLAAGHRFHERGQHTLALAQYEEAIQLGWQLGDNGLMAYLFYAAGGEYRDCDDYHSASAMLIKALLLVHERPNTRELAARIKKTLAITFSDLFGAHKPEALQFLEEALKDFVELGLVLDEANTLQHIGGIHRERGNLLQSDRILGEALDKARQAQDAQLEGWILDNLARLEIERGEWGMGLEYTQQARSKVREVEDAEGEGDTWLTEAQVWLHTGQEAKALDAVQRALALFTQNANMRRTIHAHRLLARVLVAMAQVEEALVSLERAMACAVQLRLRREQAKIYLHDGRLRCCKQGEIARAHEQAVRARALAEEEGLDEVVAEAEALLHHIRRDHDGKE